MANTGDVLADGEYQIRINGALDFFDTLQKAYDWFLSHKSFTYARDYKISFGDESSPHNWSWIHREKRWKDCPIVITDGKVIVDCIESLTDAGFRQKYNLV